MPMLVHAPYSRKSSSQENLFTSQELQSGVALRVIACFPGEFNREIVEVRVITTLRQKHSLIFSESRSNSQLVDSCRIVFRAKREVAKPRGWVRAYEEEYAIDVPADAGTVTLNLVGTKNEYASLSITQDQRKQLLDQQLELMRNPFVDSRYHEWLKQHQSKLYEDIDDTKTDKQVLFSIICPVFHTPKTFLEEMIQSVLSQVYENWELILINASPDDEDVLQILSSFDDSRIRIINHPENDGINGNTNVGIAAATGNYIAFLDHDDVLDECALQLIAQEIASHPETDIIYTDEDSFDENYKSKLPLFKPDYDYSLLLSNDYSLHFEVVSKRIIDLTERSSAQTNGAQDYDLMFKASDNARRIAHIPRILYHWRIHDTSINAGNTKAKRFAEIAGEYVIASHLRQHGFEANITREPIPFTFKTIITPANSCSISVIVDSCSKQQFKDIKDRLQTDGVEFFQCSNPFGRKNLASLRNNIAYRAKSNYLLFIGGDDAPFTEDFLDTMRSYLELPQIGMVVPELLFPDGQRVDSGWIVCADGTMTHINQGIAPWDGGYNGYACRPHQWTVVNPAIQLVRREEFIKLGGYATDYNTITYASADLCLRYRKLGLNIVYTPYAAAFHSEPSQQVYASLPHNVIDSLNNDCELFKSRWLINDWFDPCYNPNLDSKSPYFKLKW